MKKAEVGDERFIFDVSNNEDYLVDYNIDFVAESKPIYNP